MYEFDCYTHGLELVFARTREEADDKFTSVKGCKWKFVAEYTV